jgi:hypothetical protein
MDRRSPMIHHVSISGGILIVGAPDVLTACRIYTPLSVTTDGCCGIGTDFE